MRYGGPFRILVLLLLFLPEAAIAQSVYGTIKGALTRQKTGEPVPKALVLVSSLERGTLLQFSVLTDDSGYFVFSNLPLGAYSLRMQKDGFKTFEEPLVSVLADTPSEVHVKLTEGDPAEKEVDDGSAVSILKIDRADVTTSFVRRDVSTLPVFVQNISAYELLVPGAVRTTGVLSGILNPQNGVYASISGQHFSGTTVMLDGTDDRDALQGIVVLNPSPDSVSQLKITTQNSTAEFGPAVGGVVAIQTRAGTNALHGSMFGYRLSGFGQAGVPDFGQSSVNLQESQKRNDFGASLSGAPIRNRLFLFGDYRGVRRSADGTVLLTVPTATVHQTCTGKAVDGKCDLSAYAKAGAQGLFKARNKVGNTDKCFQSLLKKKGIMPNSCVSPEMVKFLDLLPLPNFGPAGALTNNFVASGVDAYSEDSSDVRADYILSTRARSFVRYSFADFRDTGAPAFGAAGGWGSNPSAYAGLMKDRNQGISAGVSFNVSPALLTDFRFGFLRLNLRLDSPDKGTLPIATGGTPIAGLNLLGDPYTWGLPDIQLDNPNLPKFPIAGGIDFIRFGYSPAVNSCNCPLREREQQFQIANNWTKLLGKHNVRWGADFRYLQNFRLSSDRRRAGHLEFTSNKNFATGFALSDFLTGSVVSFDRAYNNPDNPVATNAGERQKRIFSYLEDTWRVSSRLSINYGLRWEIYLPQSVTASDAGGWLQLQSGTTPVNDEFFVAGQAGTNLQGGVKPTFRNLGPRLGFSYLVNSKTVVRAGYARSFDPGYAGTLFGIAATQSPPVGMIATIRDGFTVNSNADPSKANPTDICVQGGACAVPAFTFAAAPFTIKDMYQQNLIHSLNPNVSPEAQMADLYAVPRRLRLPTVDAWNLAIQEALDRLTYLEIAYVANKGTHVLNDTNGNVPYYDLNQPTLQGFIQPATINNGNNCQPNSTGAFCETTDVSRQAFQPWSSQVRYFGNDASSSYQSLQVKVRRQVTSGFSVLAHYTWSKIIDFDNVYYAIDPQISRGVGNFDRKHTFVMTNIWDLPVGHGHRLLSSVGPALDRLIGGWSLAAISSWASGLPFTPTYIGTECINDVGVSPFRACRPNIVGAVDITGNRNQWFTTTGGQALPSGSFSTSTGNVSPGIPVGPWQRPSPGQVGNAGRNSLRGPNFFQSDLSVAKEIPVTERVAVQFRTDAFNVFNKVNLGNPIARVDAPNAGDINSLATGAIQRRLQFSLRVSF